MKPDLEPTKNVLRSFLSEISDVVKIREGISAPISTPFNFKDSIPDLSGVDFEPASDTFWIEDNAYTWIYAEAWHYGQLMQYPKNTEIPKYYLQQALPIYEDWLNEEKDITYRGTIIPAPGDVNLHKYLVFLAECIQDKNEKRTVWIKSLKSFLQYIREDIPFELQGSLDCIFPYKMEIRRSEKLQWTEDGIIKIECGFILRNIEDTVYPIDVLIAAEILQNLAMEVLEGRPNGQHTAAEALGFAWLCHVVGSARLMTREKIVYNTSLKALRTIDSTDGSSGLPIHFITISTFNGLKEIPISKTLYDFLVALPRSGDDDSIFSKPISTLLRTLYDKGISQSERARSLGKITFRTFMSQSTHWYGHRPGQVKTR